jgi:hypothetical protein
MNDREQRRRRRRCCSATWSMPVRVEQPLQALVLELPRRRDNVVTRVRVEASDDLARWTTLVGGRAGAAAGGGRAAARATAHRVRCRGGRSTFRLSLAGGSASRCHWSALAASRASALVEAPRQWKQVAGSADRDKAGEYAFDLGGQFPVDRLRLLLPQPNSVASVEVLSRANAATIPGGGLRLSDRVPARRGRAGGGQSRDLVIAPTAIATGCCASISAAVASVPAYPNWPPAGCHSAWCLPRAGARTVSTRLRQRQRRAGRLPDRDAGAGLPRRGRRARSARLPIGQPASAASRCAHAGRRERPRAGDRLAALGACGGACCSAWRCSPGWPCGWRGRPRGRSLSGPATSRARTATDLPRRYAESDPVRPDRDPQHPPDDSPRWRCHRFACRCGASPRAEASPVCRNSLQLPQSANGSPRQILE